MSTKKKGGKSKGKPEDGPTPQELLKVAESFNMNLNQQILIQNYDDGLSVSTEKDLNKQLEILEEEIEQEADSFSKSISDMNKCFKASQDSLLIRVTELTQTISDLREQLSILSKINIDLSKESIEITTKEKEKLIQTKDIEINEMKIKMELMANEFGDMLKVIIYNEQKEILDKMSERIEINNTEWKKDGTPMIKKLEDFIIGTSK